MTTTTRATTRARLSPEQLRAALIELGLREEEKPIAGYAYTMFKEPQAAMSFYAETHGGAVARRFYLHARMYVLAE